MKKYKKDKNFKRWHDRRSKKIGQKPKLRKKTYRYDSFKKNNQNYTQFAPKTVLAPPNLKLLEETEDCLDFIWRLRQKSNLNNTGKYRYIQMSLENVEAIDYSTICILIALKGDLKANNIFLRVILPKNNKCQEYITDSGLLNDMFKESGENFPESKKSDLLFIEKGIKKLTRDDNIRISETVQNVVGHLTGTKAHCKQLRTILLEICGNSIEWAETKNNQWLIGVKYEKNKVIFTITDVGKGILKTLKKKFAAQLKDIFTSKKNDEVLRGAFIKKYGSKSNKINRNKGLPAIKSGFDDGLLKDLKVLTNNVILHYDKNESSKVLTEPISFKGTLYRWVITKNSLRN
ncbi:MAG: hypothetical protein RJQ05_13255 [Cytophagales bacterium]|jgi:hypothetical protein